MSNDQNTNLTFPCTFPIKVMGEQEAELEAFVKEAVAKQIQAPETIEIKSRLSQHNKYISVTATFTAHNKAELDELYRILSAHPAVKMVL